MPMPDYRHFRPAQLRVGDEVISAVGDPWVSDWPWERVETVTARPPGLIVTDHTTYLWTGRQARTLLRFWSYPRRITAARGDC